ncbi:hypothetical protein MAA8898_00892 [Maliponia aquimaris]|uniref:BioF2-like acetyltransferase domain-containing protein n=2 Tax=Maliponia aquimaris TaxID=1673631 RepID=A0A238K0R9_9RHOB|nr:hypothetical protein MAA8898_00892 [Maliponia aquimaris]
MLQTPDRSRFSADMDVSLVDSLTGFDALREPWEALGRRDLESSVFLSWGWLRRSFCDNPARWSVLTATARGSQQLAGALPLKYRLHWSRSRNRLQTEIECGTRLSHAPCGGLLCAPEVEDQVIDRFARALQTMPWSKFTLAYLPQGGRVEKMAQRLAAQGCRVTVEDPASAPSGKRMVARVLPLPDSIEELLAGQVSREVAALWGHWRARMGRGDLHLRFAAAQDLDPALAALDALAKARGDRRARDRLKEARPALRIAAAEQCLVLPHLWAGETLLGGLAHVFDPLEGTLTHLAGVTGQDSDARAMLTLLAMQWAIENGGLFYDFGRISSRYSRGFETEKEASYTLTATRDADADLCLDPINSAAAVQRIADFVKAGEPDKAMRACDQLARLLQT